MVVLGKVRKSGGMGIIRCEKGLHFYDNVKYDKCPYCEQRKQQIQKNTNIMQEQKTVAVQAEKLSELEEYICRQEKEKIEANDYGRTIGYYSPVRGNDYVTGWLVCVKGPEKGRDYRLHHGFNRLGRSMDMDVIFRKTEAFHGIRIARLYMMGNPIIFI